MNNKSNIKSTRDVFKESFTVCYLVLFGTAAITFIEALRNSNVHARHILNLETAVSLTAGVVYGMFITMVDREDFDLKKVAYYRYVDWSITTPMLLLVLLLFITFHSKKSLSISWYLIIVILNYIMLLCGYFGEIKYLDKRLSQIFGFAAFITMLVVIYTVFLYKKSLLSPEVILFLIFSIVWGMYGVAAEFDDYAKNIMYNILDVIAKVFLGLGLWAYYGGVTSLSNV